LDNNYRVNHHWAEEIFDVKPLARLPSEYIKEHCWWGFMYNPVGVQMRHEVGVDRLMWSTDFPHIESDWPNSMGIIREMFADVPADETHKMVAGNSIDFFHLDRG
jgi:predicted TIM-barrel fold metal-dependent hydrolase